MNFVTKRSLTIGDGNAALIGLLFAMLVPATLPWWAVLTGTFVAVIIGKQIFGGIGSNAFNPVVLSIAILMVSWKDLFDFDEALLNYDLEFTMLYPIAALKHFGTASIESFTAGDLLLGKQTGGIGATFGLGLIIGGIYLIIRGFIRWEICLTFLLGVFATALIFNLYDGSRFATEDSSSPVNFIPMLIFGAGAGALTVLIRNIGAHVDGVIYAILVMNLVNPVLDKIRPKAIGKVG